MKVSFHSKDCSSRTRSAPRMPPKSNRAKKRGASSIAPIADGGTSTSGMTDFGGSDGAGSSSRKRQALHRPSLLGCNVRFRAGLFLRWSCWLACLLLGILEVVDVVYAQWCALWTGRLQATMMPREMPRWCVSALGLGVPTKAPSFLVWYSFFRALVMKGPGARGMRVLL